jgi:hypothetical protein
MRWTWISIRRGEGIEDWLVREKEDRATVAARNGRATGARRHAPKCP